jgi:transposase InsO family protein
MLIDRLGLSERRACQITGQARSTQRRKPQITDSERELRTWLVEFSKKKPRYGYRRAHAIARKNGFAVNRKKIQRIWREEGLKVTHKAKKRSRLGTSATEARHLEAEHPNHVWAIDFQDDQTADGRRLRILNIVDEFTREVLAVEVARSITADRTVEVLEELLDARGRAPSYIRMDNGPELTSHALADWCRFSGTGAAFIEPGSPWQNAYVESLNSRIRDELLNQELFHTLLEAQVLAEDWRIDHNRHHPHSALGMLSPDEFAAIWRRSGTTTATPTP